MCCDYTFLNEPFSLNKTGPWNFELSKQWDQEDFATLEKAKLGHKMLRKL